MRKIKFALVIILILALIETYNIKKPRNIFEGVGNVSQITLFDLGSKESVHLDNEDHINYYINMFNQIIYRKGKIVGNFSATGLVVILYDENGSTKDTLYVSEDFLIRHHRRLKLIHGENPYNELMKVFKSRLLKDTL